MISHFYYFHSYQFYEKVQQAMTKILQARVGCLVFSLVHLCVQVRVCECVWVCVYIHQVKKLIFCVIWQYSLISHH